MSVTVSHTPALSFRSKQPPFGPRTQGSDDSPLEIEESSDESPIKRKGKSLISRKSRKEQADSFASSTATSEFDEDHYLSHRKTLAKSKEQPKASATIKERPIASLKTNKQRPRVSSIRPERPSSSRSSPESDNPHFLGVYLPPRTEITDKKTTKAAGQSGYQAESRPKTKKAGIKGPARRNVFRKTITIEGPPLTLVNEIDNDKSPLQFRFIDDHVCTPGTARVSEEFQHGCDCNPENGQHIGCEYLACECLDDAAIDQNGKKIFPYWGTGGKKGCLRPQFLNSRNHIFECNANCNCGPECRNRVVQHGRTLPLEIFKTESRGWGLRCTADLQEGQFIDTYRGEVITNEEATTREEANGPGKQSYLYSLDKFAEEREYTDDQVLVVDGQHMGGPTRFINHSCEPNCRQFTVSLNHADDKIYELAFFALNNIPAGTELTFNYTDSEDAPISDEEARKRAKEAGQEPIKCLCGADKCRKWLWL